MVGGVDETRTRWRPCQGRRASPLGSSDPTNRATRWLAGSTRLELATSGVTGRRSNQLNYDPAAFRMLSAELRMLK